MFAGIPNRSLVVVSVQGRQYTVQVEGGSIVDVALSASADPQFSASGFGSSTIPSGVIQGSEFAPGQQLRMLRDLNIRQDRQPPAVPVVGTLDPGDYVAILAGPHREGIYEWWRSPDGELISLAGSPQRLTVSLLCKGFEESAALVTTGTAS